MQIHVSPDDGLPVYKQIFNQVKYLVASGVLRPDEELPPIRVLAEQLLINPNTVARAYQELERMGLIENLLGKGAFIRGEITVNDTVLFGARKQLAAALIEMTLAGMDRGAIHAEVDAALSKFGREA